MYSHFYFIPLLIGSQDHGCVKIPKDLDFSSIDKDPPHIVKGFNAKLLQGTWYKVRATQRVHIAFI